MADRDKLFIEIPSELGAGLRGASLGPQAVRLQDAENGSKIYTNIPVVEIKNYNHVLHSHNKYPHAKYINWVLKTAQHTQSEVHKRLDQGFFPILMTGDHSNAFACISGVKEHLNDKRLGVVWIDAHGDLHSPFTSPSGNMHGMPLAAALGDDYRSVVVNDLDLATKEYWNSYTTIGNKGLYPKISARDLVLIGIRDLEQEEWNDIYDNNIKYFDAETTIASKAQLIAQQTLKHLDNCDAIYISFDVDSMDPTFSKGTGTSVPGGISPTYATELLRELMKSNKIIALEITEINPLLDTENKMAKIVLDVLKNII